jgi:hypothetical protein
LAIGQVLPSFPDEKIWGYETPKVSNEVKSITETLKVGSDDNDFLKISRITKSHFYRTGKIKRVDFVNTESKDLKGSVYFDSYGRIKKRENLDSDYTVRFTYDDRKGISCKSRPKPDVYGMKYNVIQYDLELLKPKIEKRYRSKDMLIDSTTYSYNSQGDIKTKIVYNTSGYGITLGSSITGGEEKKDVLPHDTTRFEYKYNDVGKVRVKTKFWLQGPYKQYIYSQSGDTLITTKKEYKKYSDRKWQVEEVTKKVGNITIKLIYLNSSYFDDIKKIYKNDRLTALIRFKDNKVTNRIDHSYEITKDALGHWISMRHFKKGELVEVKKREIQYWN